MYFFLEKKQKAYHVSKTYGLTPDPHLHTHIEMVFMRKGSTVGVADLREDSVSSGDLFVLSLIRYITITTGKDRWILIC